MKRPVWLAAGVAIGIGGTLWAEQRVRREVDRALARLSPEQLAAGALGSVRQTRDRVRQAVEAGQRERRRQEVELRTRYGLEPTGTEGTVVTGAWGAAGRRR